MRSPSTLLLNKDSSGVRKEGTPLEVLCWGGWAVALTAHPPQPSIIGVSYGSVRVFSGMYPLVCVSAVGWGLSTVASYVEISFWALGVRVSSTCVHVLGAGPVLHALHNADAFVCSLLS